MKPKDLPSPKFRAGSLGNWLNSARSILKQQLPEEPFSSLYALSGHVLEKPVHFGISHPEYLLSEKETAELNDLLARLVNGTPLPYLTGKQAFYGLDFTITPDVLIPRPETELLVEQAILWLKDHPDKRKCLDIGSGSGCIAVSICANVPNARFIATDKSFPALELAKENAKKNHVNQNISLVQMDLLSGLTGQFDCLCANLPYIPSERLPKLAVSRQEPLLALDGGPRGTVLINELLQQSAGLIAKGGVIFLEIDCSQQDAVIEMTEKALPQARIKIENDLAGLPRVAIIQL